MTLHETEKLSNKTSESREISSLCFVALSYWIWESFVKQLYTTASAYYVLVIGIVEKRPTLSFKKLALASVAQ